MSLVRCLGAVCIAVGVIAVLGCSKSSDPPGDGSTASIPGSSGQNDPAIADGKTSGKSARSAAEDRFPIVQFETSLGTFRVKLDRDKAPETVSNFLTNVQNGVYNGTVFHRVWKDYVVMGGSHTPELKEKPFSGLPIRHEGRKSLRKNLRGTIAMERKPESMDSATHGFFINLANNANLDFAEATPAKCGYCVFGDVIDDGMAVLDKIGQVEITPKAGFEQLPKNPVEIVAVQRIQQR